LIEPARTVCICEASGQILLPRLSLLGSRLAFLIEDVENRLRKCRLSDAHALPPGEIHRNSFDQRVRELLKEMPLLNVAIAIQWCVC
jgi:hypothetical protein